MVTAAEPIAHSEDADDDGPGWASTWIRSDPARFVGVLLVLVQVAWRAKVSAGGFMVQDDFPQAIRSVEQGLTRDYLFAPIANHLLPVPNLYFWWATKTFGYAYWPYLAAMLLVQAVAGFSFLRLLRRLIPAGWGLLIPLSVFLFSPLNLESTSWATFGLNAVPLELAMIWAMSAQVNFVQSGHRRHLVSLAASFVFGLLFTEKAAFIVPLVFGLTACLLVRGSPGRAIWRALTRYWLSWVVLLVPLAGYLFFYKVQVNYPAARRPDSVDQVTTFFEQIVGKNLIPGLMGGPWTWLEGNDVPLTTTSPLLEALALIGALAFIAFTIWRRPAAGRAWILFFGYAFIDVGLIAVSRMGGPLSFLAGLVTRYTSDIVVVGALCIGVALFGVRHLPDRRPARRIAWFGTARGRKVARIAGALLAVILATGTVISTSKYERAWGHQTAERFLRTSQASLAKAPPGMVFFDQAVPEGVMAAWFYPNNMQSRFFIAAAHKPHFVAEAENPMVITGSGEIKPAFVKPARKTKPGPNGQCGYEVKSTRVVTMPLDGPLLDWPWALRIAYLSNTTTPLTVQLGQNSVTFTAQQGLHQYFFFLQGSGNTLYVRASASGADLCVADITVGEVVPWLL